ncbi:MAG: hypothetical protein PHF46_01640 [Candidatus Gracilibacteria bacterium]|nr:hypothetical protein [Candidatus Gracilibacteria bacterium]MDD3120093.1 hypothetical protein [Candidatus Gracilibacteria bacterium]MDD4530732.1 hypothetical protein [Candidatus Gracilibacteria bacterium]
MEALKNVFKQFSKEDLKDKEINEEKIQNERFKRMIVTNIFITFIISLYFYYEIYPVFPTIEENVAISKEKFDYNNKLTNNGVDGSSLTKILTQDGANKEKLSEIMKNQKEILVLIEKPKGYSGTYLDWVSEELNKKSELEDEIKRNEEIIGNIIPTYYPLSVNDKTIEEADKVKAKTRISLYSLVYYIEENILKKYNLVSTNSIGIDGIKFEKTNILGGNIGTLSFSLDFKGTNSNIRDFLDEIQSSGKLNIKDGKLYPRENVQSGSTLNNILITIEELSFNELIIDLDEQNSGNIKLNLYINGVDAKDVLDFKLKIKEDAEKLKNQINKVIPSCNNLNNAFIKSEEGINTCGGLKKALSQIEMIKKNVDSNGNLTGSGSTETSKDAKNDSTANFERISKISISLNKIQEDFDKLSKILIDKSNLKINLETSGTGNTNTGSLNNNK